MKTSIALVVSLCLMLMLGCASLESLTPKVQTDPQVAAAETLLKTAPVNISRFLKFERANRRTIGLDAQNAARGLRERWRGNVADLKALCALYEANRSPVNRSHLMMAMETVRADEGLAASYLNGQILPQHSGAPFAPPLNVPQPVYVPTVDLTPMQQQIDALRQALAHQRALLREHGITNAPPPPPPAPPGLPVP